ncbi:MAG: OsmC family peroxiredoxin [Dehalococcoidia bacterium]|nr:OsmC family peroxiredoxin [Dehalococcoidia bacterium]
MAVMERRASIVWEGDIKGTGTLKSGDSAFPDLTVTFSARTEQADGKTSPEELIAAAHATCYAMAFSNTLATNGATPKRLEVSALCTLDRIEGALTITVMDLTVRGSVDGVDAAKFQELANMAKERCPVSKALKGNVQINLTATLA